MEIYAAMIEHLDGAVGRVIADLKASGEFDNTVIFFLSDNGAEARDVPIDAKAPPPPLDTLGTARSYVNYGAGWALAATAPSWRFKTFATEGGIRAPAFVAAINAAAANRTFMFSPFFVFIAVRSEPVKAGF